MINTIINHIIKLPLENIYSLIIIYLGLILLMVLFISYKLTKKNRELKDYQKQHASKINQIRKEHAETLENIRNEMLKKEEHRITQWAESEKEILHALNGISYLFEIAQKIDKKEINIYIQKMDEIINLIKKFHGNGED